MLKGKTILVTGASSGIGSGIIKVLASQNAKLILSARNKTRLKEAVNSLNGTGHVFYSVNLIDNNQLDELVSKLPKLDGVVFCAGYNEFVPFKFIKKEKAEKIFDLNYFSTVYLTQKLLKKKILNKGASLVFISSISSKLGVPATSLYSASKAAINSTVKVLASELAPQKIRANAICPGIVITPMLEQGNVDKSQIMEQEKLYPLGFGTPEDVANAVAFHLSDASRWLTGNIMNLDGGFTLK